MIIIFCIFVLWWPRNIISVLLDRDVKNTYELIMAFVLACLEYNL